MYNNRLYENEIYQNEDNYIKEDNYNTEDYYTNLKNDETDDNEVNTISSSIDRPEYEAFEKGKSKALYQMNKKKDIYIKKKQELQGEIDAFNEQMTNLLELSKCHEKPFNLNEIKLEHTINNENIQKDHNEEVDRKQKAVDTYKAEAAWHLTAAEAEKQEEYGGGGKKRNQKGGMEEEEPPLLEVGPVRIDNEFFTGGDQFFIVNGAKDAFHIKIHLVHVLDDDDDDDEGAGEGDAVFAVDVEIPYEYKTNDSLYLVFHRMEDGEAEGDRIEFVYDDDNKWETTIPEPDVIIEGPGCYYFIAVLGDEGGAWKDYPTVKIQQNYL